MARKGSVKKRDVAPDAVYGRVIISKLINYVMRSGKKSVAEKIVYGSFDLVQKKAKSDDPMGVFDTAMGNVKPGVEVRSRRVGGATYQVPTEVREDRAIALCLNWIVQSAQKRSEKSMEEKLAGEIVDAFNNRGGAVTSRVNKEKMAEANKAFAHYRW